MKKAYILIYNDAVGAREDIAKWADNCPLVINWRYDLPNCFYLISEATAEQIGRHFHETFNLSEGSSGRFLITESSPNRWGWLPVDTWYLLANLEHKPK